METTRRIAANAANVTDWTRNYFEIVPFASEAKMNAYEPASRPMRVSNADWSDADFAHTATGMVVGLMCRYKSPRVGIYLTAENHGGTQHMIMATYS